MKDTNHVMGHLKTAKTIYGDKENRERTEATPQYLICNYIFGKNSFTAGLANQPNANLVQFASPSFPIGPFVLLCGSVPCVSQCPPNSRRITAHFRSGVPPSSPCSYSHLLPKAFPALQLCQNSQRISCVIPHSILQHGITQPICTTLPRQHS